MQGQGQGFSVTISAFDQFTNTINNFNKAIRQSSQQIQQFQTGQAQQAGRRDSFFDRVSTFTTRGARELSRGFREVGTVAVDMGRKIATAFEPLAILGGVGGGIAGALGIAGLAASINNLSRAGADLERTSQRIGVGTTELQRLDAAAQLAGVSTGRMGEALETLGQKVTAAALGQDPQAMAFFKQFNIALRNQDNSIRSSVSVLEDLADAFVKIKNPQVQAEFASRAFVGAAADMLPFLREGRDGIRQYREEAAKYGYALSDRGVAAAREFEKAQARLNLAIKGFGNKLVEILDPILIPVINAMAKWVATNRDWIAQDIGKGIEDFGKALRTIDYEGINKLSENLGGLSTSIPAIDLTFQRAIDDINYLIKKTNEFLDLWKKGEALGQPGYQATPRTDMGGGSWLNQFLFGDETPLGQRIMKWFGGGGRQGAAGPAPYEAISRAEGTFGRTGINYNMMQGGGTADLARMTIGEVMQMQGGPGHAAGAFQIEQGTLGDAAKALGFGDTTRFTPSVQRQMADWIYQKQGIQAWRGFLAHPELLPGAGGGRAGPGSTGWPFPTLPATPQFPNLPANTTNFGSEKPFGQSPSDYGPGSPLGRAPPAGLGGGDASPILIPGGALDSKHSVEININGAPQGTRSAITSAEGPAQATLRTHFAFSGI